MPPTDLNFDGKIVTVFLNSGSVVFADQPGWTLDSPRFEDQMGRIFLVGDSISEYRGGPPWHLNASINISWESVVYYLVFDSIEAYHDAAGQYRAEGPKPGWLARRVKS